MNALDEFLFAVHPDLPEHAARHLAEHVLHQIEPRTVLGNEDELKASRPTRQEALRSPSRCGRMNELSFGSNSPVIATGYG